jgi:hypothetical protein
LITNNVYVTKERVRTVAHITGMSECVTPGSVTYDNNLYL